MSAAEAFCAALMPIHTVSNVAILERMPLHPRLRPRGNAARYSQSNVERGLVEVTRRDIAPVLEWRVEMLREACAEKLGLLRRSLEQKRKNAICAKRDAKKRQAFARYSISSAILFRIWTNRLRSRSPMM